LFAIGARSRAQGSVPVGAGEFVMSLMRQSRLIGRYPTSH
jgi:hypothetical protein